MSEYKSEYRKKLRELTAVKASISSLESDLQKLYKKSIEFDLNLKHEEEIEILRGKLTGLNIELIRDFLCINKDAASINLDSCEIGIQGNGPWEVREFEKFLTQKDFTVVNITDPGVQYLILGVYEVDWDELKEQIRASIEGGFDLYIFSQELFVAWLITGLSPLEHWPEKELLKYAMQHQTLQYLIDYTEFPWPQLVDHSVMTKTYQVKIFEWDGALSEESPLRKMGYSVREDGLTLVERRNILNQAYTTTLLNKFLLSEHDLDRWGQPNSAQRLYAISSLITWLANFQGSTKPAAKEKWISDLDWLKESFYLSKMKFWPMRLLSSPPEKGR